jgi:hypothetical protein
MQAKANIVFTPSLPSLLMMESFKPAIVFSK